MNLFANYFTAWTIGGEQSNPENALAIYSWTESIFNVFGVMGRVLDDNLVSKQAISNFYD